MMKTSKKLFISFSAFLLIFFAEPALNLACGGEMDPYDYYVTYFHPNVAGDDYSSFFYTQWSYLYNDQDKTSEADVNSEEWAKYLDIKKEDVKKVMYETDSTAGALLLNLSKKSISQFPDSLKKNTFVQALVKNKKALQYYIFAKNCEPLANITQDYWNPVQRDSTGLLQLANEALGLLEKTKKDPFLKLRYAYQAARMSHYGYSYAQCIKIYETWIATDPSKSAAKGWATSLYAGAVRKLGEPARAAYLFSRVFESNPERQTQAYRNYFYTGAKIDSVLSYTKNDAEKASVWAIDAFGSPEKALNSLEKVYDYTPSSPIIGALLIREVNKLEVALIKDADIAKINYWNPYSDRTDSTTKIQLKNLNQVKNFALKLAAEKKYPQPELGTLTAAYLSWMEGKDAEARADLDQLRPDALTERLKDQYRITDLLINSRKIKKGSPFKEAELLPTLKWLDEKRYTENEENAKLKSYTDWMQKNQLFNLTTRNFYQQILAPAYIKMGDTAHAALAMVKGDLRERNPKEKDLLKNMSEQTSAFWHQYLSPKTLVVLEQFRKTSLQDENFDGFLAKSLKQLQNDDFYELFGTAYLRTHEYSKALACFNKRSGQTSDFVATNWYSDSEDSKLYANPFIETIRDYPKQYAKDGYNKENFAREMVRLEKRARTDKKNSATYYYKMANAIYQTGYYGNSWFLISYDWNAYTNNQEPHYYYDGDFKLAETAKKLYLKARTLSKNVNFKAKCTFMLAKCEQKQIVSTSYPDYSFYYHNSNKRYKYFENASFQNPYFRELKTKYGKTEFFHIAQEECSYLREFISSSKPSISKI